MSNVSRARLVALGVLSLADLTTVAAVPALLVPGVPIVPMVLAGTAITLTSVGVGLLLAGLRKPVLAGAR